MEGVFIQNIHLNNRARLFLFGLFLIFSLIFRLASFPVPWLIIEIIALLLFINVILEFLTKKIWSKQTISQANFGYFIFQLIEIFLLFGITLSGNFFLFFPLLIFYIIFSYFSFNRRVYPRIISLILIVGYLSFLALVYFRILNYYFPPPLFLSFSLTLTILISSVFFGENLSKSSENIFEALKGKDRNLTIIESFSDGILVLDEENKLSLINPQAELFFGIKAEGLMDKPISELTKIPVFKSLADFLGQKTEKIFRKELPLGKNLILQVTISPLIKEKEEMGTLIILHDITREKTVERIKSEFVSLSAHQLRTPLSAIKWTLRLLIEGDLGEITEEQKEFLEKTYRSNERMINLINELLNVARIEEGRYIYRPVFAQFEEICQSVIKTYKKEIEEKNLIFKFQKPKEPLPKILIDIEKMELVIENLLDNAIGYTQAGGQVTISINRDIKEIEFKIKDTGVGIPKDQQERVFTKFFRGANVMRMGTEGTGLGLFVTKNVIEAHGGRIWFESKEGKGSTFYFILPLMNPKTLQKNTKN